MFRKCREQPDGDSTDESHQARAADLRVAEGDVRLVSGSFCPGGSASRLCRKMAVAPTRLLGGQRECRCRNSTQRRKS